MAVTQLPRELYTAAQVRELDRLALLQERSADNVLMRRAATVLLHVLQHRWEGVKRLVILTGSGNNGGDGYLLAALGKEQGLQVFVQEVGAVERISGDALLAREEAVQAEVQCIPYAEAELSAQAAVPGTVLIDALLGTGFQGELRPVYVGAITLLRQLQQHGVPVLAVDVPSGLNSDTGMASTPTVVADVTVTFIGMKRGLFTGEGPVCSGDIVFSDLGVPASLYQSDSVRSFVQRIDIHAVSSLLAPRSLDSHKGSHGQVLVVGGDSGYGGAVLMAAEAACRSGAGRVSLVTRSEHVQPMLARCPEVMVRGIDVLDNASADALQALVEAATVVVLGPGLGKSAWSLALMAAVMRAAADRIPLVIDADGLNLLADPQALPADLRDANEAARARRRWVMTPHPGEAARLLGCTSAEIQQDRFAAIARLQALWGGVCLLKGVGSLLCYNSGAGDEDLRIDVCTEGNPGMASGGMGDVLSGMIAAFIAQGLSLADSLRLAVCVHGESADLAAAQLGERGLRATDLLDYTGPLINPQRRPRSLSGWTLS